MTFTSWLMGDHERAIAPGRRALAIARALGDFAPQVKRNLFLGQIYLAMGDYQQALESFRRNVASLENDRLQDRFGGAGLPFVMTHAWMVWCLAELGAFAEGIGCGEEGVRLADAVDHPFSRAAASWGLGVLYVRKGDLEKAIPLLEQSLGLCQGSDGSIWFAWIASALGSAYALSGRAAEALPLLEQAVQQADSAGMLGHQSLRVAWLSEAYLLAGRIEDALELAERALELARAHKERGHEAHVLRLLGEIAAHRDPPDVKQAEAAYRQALALADELGMRPLIAHCHLGLGTLYRQSGGLGQHRAELSAAIELFRIMDMTFWLTRGEAALAREK
jgi:tetratricopeptide (TPR) repeat protein